MPALWIQGRRVQGSRRISRTLEELRTDPPLFPADAYRAPGVADAESWGEEVLQPVPRRIFRWGTTHSQEVRRWMAAEVVGMPAPGLLAAAQAPIAWRFAQAVGASDARVRSDVAGLPTLLDRVDSLIAAGTIGGEDPNAADYHGGARPARLRGPACRCGRPARRRACDAGATAVPGADPLVPSGGVGGPAEGGKLAHSVPGQLPRRLSRLRELLDRAHGPDPDIDRKELLERDLPGRLAHGDRTIFSASRRS